MPVDKKTPVIVVSNDKNGSGVKSNDASNACQSSTLSIMHCLSIAVPRDCLGPSNQFIASIASGIDTISWFDLADSAS